MTEIEKKYLALLDNPTSEIINAGAEAVNIKPSDARVIFAVMVAMTKKVAMGKPQFNWSSAKQGMAFTHHDDPKKPIYFMCEDNYEKDYVITCVFSNTLGFTNPAMYHKKYLTRSPEHDKLTKSTNE